MCAGSNSLPSLARTTDSPHPMQQNRLAAFVTVFVAWLRQTPKRLRFGFVRCGGIEPPVPIRRFAPKKRGILILYEGSDWFWSPNPEHRPVPCLALLSPHRMQQNRLAAFVTVFVAWLRQTPKRLRFGFVRCGGIEPPVPIRRFDSA